MIWQDIVISIANILFTFTLVYQVYYGFKIKRGLLTLITSSLTTIGLYAIALSFFTLNLYFSGVISTINATLWLILFIQRIIYSKA